MSEDKLNAFTDNVYNVMLQKGASGKMSDFINAFNEIKSLLKAELNTEFTRGYITAKNEYQNAQTIKQQKEN